MKLLVRKPELYSAPAGDAPPPLWIRGVLVLTCTGVSFAHGSNDGQKGMGLIMLILIGTVPTAYALNRAVPANHVPDFVEASEAAATVVDARGPGVRATNGGDAARHRSSGTSPRGKIDEKTYPSLALLIRDIAKQVGGIWSFDRIPAAKVGDTRNDMYVASEAVRFRRGQGSKIVRRRKVDALDVTSAGTRQLDQVHSELGENMRRAGAWPRHDDRMEADRRDRRRKDRQDPSDLRSGRGGRARGHGTIFAADNYGLPVSTTHILSSGVAGTMAANGSGVQVATLRNIVLAWVLTLALRGRPLRLALLALRPGALNRCDGVDRLD